MSARSAQGGPFRNAIAIGSAGAEAGKTVPARWMTAQSRQYSPTAGAARLESVLELSPALEMLPMAVGDAGQQRF